MSDTDMFYVAGLEIKVAELEKKLASSATNNIGNKLRVDAMKSVFEELDAQYVSLAKREHQYSAECRDTEDIADAYKADGRAEAYEYAAFLMEESLKRMYLDIHKAEKGV